MRTREVMTSDQRLVAKLRARADKLNKAHAVGEHPDITLLRDAARVLVAVREALEAVKGCRATNNCQSCIDELERSLNAA
jgi:hypothetical protein